MKLNYHRKKEASFLRVTEIKLQFALFPAPDVSCFKQNHGEEEKKGAMAPSGLQNGLFSVDLSV